MRNNTIRNARVIFLFILMTMFTSKVLYSQNYEIKSDKKSPNKEWKKKKRQKTVATYSYVINMDPGAAQNTPNQIEPEPNFSEYLRLLDVIGAEFKKLDSLINKMPENALSASKQQKHEVYVQAMAMVAAMDGLNEYLSKNQVSTQLKKFMDRFFSISFNIIQEVLCVVNCNDPECRADCKEGQELYRKYLNAQGKRRVTQSNIIVGK